VYHTVGFCTQIGSKIGSQIGSKLGSQIGYQIGSQIGNRYYPDWFIQGSFDSIDFASVS